MINPIELEKANTAFLTNELFKLCRKGSFNELSAFLMKEIRNFEKFRTLLFAREEETGEMPVHAVINNRQFHPQYEVLQNERALMLFQLLQLCEQFFPDEIFHYINARDAHDRTPLMLACAAPWSSDLVAVLLTGHHDKSVLAFTDHNTIIIDASDRYGITALHLAAYSGRTESVELLLEMGASINRLTHAGESPFSLAAANGYLRTLEKLLERTPENELTYYLNECVDLQGNTPLHHATREFKDNPRSSRATVELLLKYGADYRIRNYAGLSCEDFALAHAAIYVKQFDNLAPEDLLANLFETHQEQGEKKVKTYIEQDLHIRLHFAEFIKRSPSFTRNVPTSQIHITSDQVNWYHHIFYHYCKTYQVVYFPDKQNFSFYLKKTLNNTQHEELQDTLVAELDTLRIEKDRLHSEQHQLNEDLRSLLNKDENARSALSAQITTLYVRLETINPQLAFLNARIGLLKEVSNRITDALRFIEDSQRIFVVIPRDTLLRWFQELYQGLTQEQRDLIQEVDRDPIGLHSDSQSIYTGFEDIKPIQSLAQAQEIFAQLTLPLNEVPFCLDTNECNESELLNTMKRLLGEVAHVECLDAWVPEWKEENRSRNAQHILHTQLDASLSSNRPLILLQRENLTQLISDDLRLHDVLNAQQSNVSQWSVIIILPSIYTLSPAGIDLTLEFDTPKLIYINPMGLSFSPDPRLIDLIKNGNAHLPPLLPNLFCSYFNATGRLQSLPADNAWWCVYGALMAILTGQDTFLSSFADHFGQRATLLRQYFGSLQPGKMIEPVSEVDQHIELQSLISGMDFFRRPQVIFDKISIPETQISGLTFQPIAKDGHCLFAAVSMYLGQGESVAELRQRVRAHVEENIEMFMPFINSTQNQTLEDYLDALSDSNQDAEQVEIEALARLLDRPIIILSHEGGVFNRGDLDRPGEPIFVSYNGHNHYDAFLLTGESTAKEIKEQLLEGQNNIQGLSF